VTWNVYNATNIHLCCLGSYLVVACMSLAPVKNTRMEDIGLILIFDIADTGTNVARVALR
jgi:hypothetical protein